MEKLKSIISIISGIVFIMAGILLFSCQEKRKVEENTLVKGDTITTITKEVVSDSLRPGVDNKWRDESEQLKERLDRIGAKARQKGGELGKKINENVSRLESERKNYMNDSTKSDFKERWKVFKEKTNRAIDSLDRKFDEKTKK
jgi:adenylate kinase family enzyme